MKQLFSFLLLGGLCTGAVAQTTFSEVAQSMGIIHSFNGLNPGGGVSCYDFDQDGWDDLTLATKAGEQIHFYRNLQGTGFQRLNPAPVLDISTQMHILWVDYDNDGDLDLYFTAEGPNRLYRNEGNLNLVEVTEAAGLPIESFFSYGAAWGDYDRDGYLDLYWCDRGANGPEILANRLYRNQGDGTFAETTQAAGVRDADKAPWAVGFLDYNNDLWPDLYVAQDKAKVNSLFRNLKNGTFADVSPFTGSDLAMKAMSVTVGDYNNNGFSDIYITNTEEGNKLLRNQNGMFAEVAAQAGVEFFASSWGAVFLDIDNDTDQDLYVSGMLIGSDPLNLSSACYENLGNEVFSRGINIGMEGDTVISHANAFGDFNQDGYPDIAVSNTAPFRSHLWQNSGSSKHWIKIGLEGVVSNRDGIGTQIELYSGGIRYRRFTQCGIGFQGQNGYGELFGLGEETTVDSIRLSWPSGIVNTYDQLPADQTYTFVEDSISPTAIEEISWFSQVQVRPNPLSDQLELSVELPQASVLHIRLLDGQGRLVKAWPQTRQQASWQATFSLQDLPAALYLLEIRAENGAVHYQKLIKQ